VRRREFIALLGGAAAIRSLGAHAQRLPARVLYFTYSAGYRHDVIPLSRAILLQLGSNSGVFEVTATEDISEFSSENLDRYAAVMFYTSGELPMSDAQKAALLNFVRSGRGFLGVHSATDTFYTWPDYLDLVGGYFNGHPWHQPVTIEVVDPGDPLVAFLGNSLQVEDEIYQISDFEDGYSIRRWATSRQFGRTPATSESWRMPSSGRYEGRPSERRGSRDWCRGGNGSAIRGSPHWPSRRRWSSQSSPVSLRRLLRSHRS
jgi:type 1 glutamine amidotransferase